MGARAASTNSRAAMAAARDTEIAARDKGTPTRDTLNAHPVESGAHPTRRRPPSTSSEGRWAVRVCTHRSIARLPQRQAAERSHEARFLRPKIRPFSQRLQLLDVEKGLLERVKPREGKSEAAEPGDVARHQLVVSKKDPSAAQRVVESTCRSGDPLGMKPLHELSPPSAHGIRANGRVEEWV